jgi:hypothetical protein
MGVCLETFSLQSEAVSSLWQQNLFQFGLEFAHARTPIFAFKRATN